MFNRLIFDHEMCNFIERSHNRKIASILLHGMNGVISEEGNFICRESNSIDTLSYLPKSKYKVLDQKDPFSPGIGRVNIKVGRFIKKFLSKSAFSEFGISDSEVEKFVNSFKSYFNSNIGDLKIVEGSDIQKYYLEENYFKPDGYTYGSLWNSCMRQKDRNKFLKLYSSNENIKMVVMFAEDGTVRSRALLWENVCEHNTDRTYKVMDRIYSIYDHDVNTFKMWAKENGYISKWEQSAKSETLFDIDGEPARLKLFVTLENSEFSYYPYLDTFKYFSPSRNRFSNSDYYDYAYKLVQSNGQVERESEPDEEFWDENEN
jgi:hypothetical protein